jgi:hypothetical protein
VENARQLEEASGLVVDGEGKVVAEYGEITSSGGPVGHRFVGNARVLVEVTTWL